MQRYTVKDMMCQHCVDRVTKTIVAIDPKARVNVDLDTKTVSVDGALSDKDVCSAIRSAGYEAQPAA